MADIQKNRKPNVANSFSFKRFAQLIIQRQEYGKDSIIAIVGQRRNGKSNFMLKLIQAFIQEKRKTDPDFKWSWSGNFALTPTEAPEKAEKLQNNSFEVLDEAGDVAYRGDANTLKTKNLIKFFNKSGSKCLLTIWVIPDIYQLNPKILNMCIAMVIVPYRYKDVTAAAFIVVRSPNDLTQDKFGLERVQRMLSSKKMSNKVHSGILDGVKTLKRKNAIIKVPYPRQLFRFYKSLPGFRHMIWFGKVAETFEKRYIKNVKEKQLMAHMKQETYVKKATYIRLKKMYETLLYNLKTKGTKGEGLTYQQILNLHMDEDNRLLTSKATIQSKLYAVRARWET